MLLAQAVSTYNWWSSVQEEVSAKHLNVTTPVSIATIDWTTKNYILSAQGSFLILNSVAAQFGCLQPCNIWL